MSEKKLNQLEDRVNRLKEEKIRTEEQLKNLRDKKDEITSELATFGVTPKDLGDVISALKVKISAELTEIDTQISENV